MQRLSVVAVVLAALACGCSSSKHPNYRISIPSNANKSEMFAAEELRDYLKKMTGRDHHIAAGATKRPSIVVCDQEHLREFVSSSETDSFAAKNIYLIGERGRATLSAVYDYLESQGCRFLSPRFDHYLGDAEIVPKRKYLGSTDSTATRPPDLKFRKLYVEEGHSHNAANLKQLIEWMPKAGYNTLVVPTDYNGSGRVKWDNWRDELTPELQKRDLIIEVGGHGYQNFLNGEMEGGKLFEQHPEWFGQDEKGNRSQAKSRVFCTSNSEAVEYLTSNFLAYIQARPEIQIYDFWPPDGAKWCECDECKKLGEPPDRQAILLKQVQAKVKPARPDLRLEIIAYSSYVKPPQREQIDPDVLVDFCPINQQFDAQIDDSSSKNKQYADALAEWRKVFSGDISIYSYYRKYAWDSLPLVIPHYMQKDLQWYATLPTQGVSVYSEPGDWFTYELNHYVLGKLAWDVNADVNALVHKFCDARYGDNSRIAEETLVTLGEITRKYCSVPNVPMKPADAIAAAREKLQSCIDRVYELRGRETSTSVKRSLLKLEWMCTYAVRDLEIQELRASKAPVEEVRAKATALHAWVSEHAYDGVFLTTERRLNLQRMLSRYGAADKKKSEARE